MDYEKRYYELLEKMDRAKDRVAQMPYSLKIRDDFEFARTEFLEYCTEILEKLMEENIDVLKNLK